MKHNTSQEKNINVNAKGVNDYDNGKTTNKGINLIFYSLINL